MIFISIILRCTLDLWLMIRKTFFTTKTWYLHSSFTLFYSYILPTSCLLVFPFYLSIPSMPFSFSLSTCIEGIVYLSIDRYPNALILRVDTYLYTMVPLTHFFVSVHAVVALYICAHIFTYLKCTFKTISIVFDLCLPSTYAIWYTTFVYLVPTLPLSTPPLST